jgi:hypothetical protein
MTMTLPSPTNSTSPLSTRPGVPAAPIPEALAVQAARTAVALETSLSRFLAADSRHLGHPSKPRSPTRCRHSCARPPSAPPKPRPTPLRRVAPAVATRSTPAHPTRSTSRRGEATTRTRARTLPIQPPTGRLEPPRTRRLGRPRHAAPRRPGTRTLALGLHPHRLPPGAPGGSRRGGRTDRQRPGGGDLSAGPVPAQVARAVLVHGRRRGAAVSGNLLAQRTPGPALPPHRLRPCKKPRCAPSWGARDSGPPGHAEFPGRHGQAHPQTFRSREAGWKPARRQPPRDAPPSERPATAG